MDAQWADDHYGGLEDMSDEVCTMDVQILLSWFFDVTDPIEVACELPNAA